MVRSFAESAADTSWRHLPVTGRRSSCANRGGAFLVGAAQRRRARSPPAVQPPLRPEGRGAARAPGRRSTEAAAGRAAVGAGTLVESESVPRNVAAPCRHAFVLGRSLAGQEIIWRSSGRGAVGWISHRTLARRRRRAR